MVKDGLKIKICVLHIIFVQILLLSITMAVFQYYCVRRDVKNFRLNCTITLNTVWASVDPFDSPLRDGVWESRKKKCVCFLLQQKKAFF